MRASAIFGPSSSERDLRTFRGVPQISWRIGVPASANEADVILLFGGDGTIHRHLPHLIKLQLPVLVVPRGSGNDLARALGLRSLNDSLAVWRRFVSGAGKVGAIDIGVVRTLEQNEEHYFCTVAGVGLDGEVVRRADRLPRWLRGKGGYLLTLLPVLFRFAALSMKITMTGGAPEASLGDGFRPTILAAFANVPTYGGGMKIAPQAQLDDGQLDICVIRDINKFKLLCLFHTVYFGRHLGITEVEYSQATSLQLETEYPLDVYADGEYVCQTPIEVSLKRSALRVIVSESYRK